MLQLISLCGHLLALNFLEDRKFIHFTFASYILHFGIYFQRGLLEEFNQQPHTRL